MKITKLDTTELHIKIKNSLFCGLKGWLIFNLANITLLHNFLHGKFFGKDSRFSPPGDEDYKTSLIKIKYQIKNNVVPFFEVTVVMPSLFIATHFIGKYIFQNQHTAIMYLTCFIACMTLTFTICLTLRLLGIRKDCCDNIKHPIYRNSECGDNSFINFMIPKDKEHLAKLNGITPTSILRNICNKKNNDLLMKAKAILFSILMVPIIAIRAILELSLLVIQTIELPCSLIFDILVTIREIKKDGDTKFQFNTSRKNVQEMSSLLYAGLRDLIVVCSLGLLNAETIKSNGSSKAPISYLDKIFTESFKERCSCAKT